MCGTVCHCDADYAHGLCQACLGRLCQVCLAEAGVDGVILDDTALTVLGLTWIGYI